MSIEVTPASAGWTYSGLTVLTLAPGSSHALSTGPAETLVFPLSGGCTVSVEGDMFEVTGRPSVFEATTDFVYLPRSAEAEIHSTAGAKLAFPSAVCERRLPPR